MLKNKRNRWIRISSVQTVHFSQDYDISIFGNNDEDQILMPTTQFLVLYSHEISKFSTPNFLQSRKKPQNLTSKASTPNSWNLWIRSRKLQLQMLKVCELVLEIFSAERIVLAYWKKRKEERGKKIFELLKGEEEGRELVSRCGTNLFESSTLNFVFVTQNTLSHTHTHKKKTLNGFNSKLCSSVKTNKIFEKLQNLIFFQNFKTKQISLRTWKPRNLWKAAKSLETSKSRNLWNLRFQF
jgi:hypothetical protein